MSDPILKKALETLEYAEYVLHSKGLKECATDCADAHKELSAILNGMPNGLYLNDLKALNIFCNHHPDREYLIRMNKDLKGFCSGHCHAHTGPLSEVIYKVMKDIEGERDE